MQLEDSDRTFKRPRCCFAFWWAIATVGGFLLSLSCFFVGERPDLHLWHGVLGGGAVGLLQGAILMRYGLGSGWWLLANILAWGIAAVSPLGVIGWFAPRGAIALTSRAIYGVLNGLEIGILTGVIQWLILKQIVPKLSQCWIFWNTLAWITGLPIGWVLGGKFHQITSLFISEVIGLFVTWSVVGCIGGIGMALLLRAAWASTESHSHTTKS